MCAKNKPLIHPHNKSLDLVCNCWRFQFQFLQPKPELASKSRTSMLSYYLQSFPFIGSRLWWHTSCTFYLSGHFRDHLYMMNSRTMRRVGVLIPTWPSPSLYSLTFDKSKYIKIPPSIHVNGVGFRLPFALGCKEVTRFCASSSYHLYLTI
jgi:hypothetical protein